MVFLKIKDIVKKVQKLIIVLIIFVFAWETFIWIFDINSLILPHLFEMFSELINNFNYIFSNILITFYTALLGCCLGAVVAITLSIAMVYNKFCEEIFYPIIVFSQTIPILVIAPILIIWFGVGLMSKVVIAAMLSFFPLVVNLNTGFRSVKEETLELLKIYGANKFQIFFKVRVYSAMSFFFAGLKTAITLSFIGAIVGEFVSSEKGIGHLVIMADNELEIPLEFAAIFFLSIISYLIYHMVLQIEKKVIYWQV